MAKTYRQYVPEQDLLLPPSLRDWLPDDHLVYFVSDLVDQLDLSAITTAYESGTIRIKRNAAVVVANDPTPSVSRKLVIPPSAV